MRAFCSVHVLPRGPPRRRPVGRPLPAQELQKKPRRGRKAVWIPKAFTTADFDRGKELLAQWGRNTSAKQRVLSGYELACALGGHLPTDPKSAVALLGQFDNAGLGPGSAQTYMTFVRSKYRGAAVEPLYAAEVRYADFENGHAPDVEDECLWRYVELAQGRLQSLLYLLYVAGFRTKASKYFERSRIWIQQLAKWREREFCLEVVVTVDKNRRRRAHRTTLRLPSVWDIKQPPLTVIEDLQEGFEDEKLFAGMTATKVNSYLKSLAALHGLPRTTTYSFRRGYLNRVAQLVSNKKELTGYSLHFAETTVEAFYRRRTT